MNDQMRRIMRALWYVRCGQKHLFWDAMAGKR
jgi:hypothetical protein